MMNTDNFFAQISKPIEEKDSGLLIERLFKFSQAINQMSPDDLISLFQALIMLKRTQPRFIFKKNPVRTSITDTQLIVIQAMNNHKSHFERFNKVICDVWVGGNQYTICKY